MTADVNDGAWSLISTTLIVTAAELEDDTPSDTCTEMRYVELDGWYMSG